jgi:hypothetical protein
MKRITLITLCLVAMASCEHQPAELPECLTAASGFVPENCPDHGTCKFSYYCGSKLDVTEGEYGLQKEVKAGDNMVFHFEYTRIVSPLILDAGYSESIWFEVKPKGDSFLIGPEDLQEAGAIFGRSCFCPDVGFFRMTQGCIYGRKTGNNCWEISLNLTVASESTTFNRMKQVRFIRSARPD